MFRAGFCMNTAAINAKLTMESAIRQAQREERKLWEAVLNSCNKVNTNNNNIDNVIKETPTKLHVSVSAADAD